MSMGAAKRTSLHAVSTWSTLELQWLHHSDAVPVCWEARPAGRQTAPQPKMQRVPRWKIIVISGSLSMESLTWFAKLWDLVNIHSWWRNWALLAAGSACRSVSQSHGLAANRSQFFFLHMTCKRDLKNAFVEMDVEPHIQSITHLDAAVAIGEMEAQQINAVQQADPLGTGMVF